MPDDGRWQTDATELMCLFRDALLALTPIADRARIGWRGPHNYDDWDDIAAALFRSLVIRSIEYSADWHGLGPVAPYDMRLDRYDGQSYVGTADAGPELAFLRLQSEAEPFDTCVFAELSPAGTILREVPRAFSATRFVAVAVGGPHPSVLTKLSVEL